MDDDPDKPAAAPSERRHRLEAEVHICAADLPLRADRERAAPVRLLDDVVDQDRRDVACPERLDQRLRERLHVPAAVVV